MDSTGNKEENPPYSVSFHELRFPFLTFYEGVKSQNKLSLFYKKPYKMGNGKEIGLVSIINSGDSRDLSKLKEMLEEENTKKLLWKSAPNIKIIGVISEDDLEKSIHLYKGYLIIILHDKSTRPEYHDQIKILAKRSEVRVQFMDKNHLDNGNPFPFKGIVTQLIAKDDGVPWILDLEDRSPFYANSMIIGVSYSSKYGRLSFGVAHFIDLLNMDEKIEIIKGGLRTDFYRGILLREQEFKNVINQAIAWYRAKAHNSDSLHIFLYETAPIRKDNTNYISHLILDPSKVNLKEFSFTHIHIKSSSYGVPRMYDLSNVGYSPEYTYMQKRGTYIKVEIQSDQTSFSMKGELIIGTTGFFLNNGNPKGTKGTPLPVYAQVTSNNMNVLDLVADQVMKLAHLDWEFLFYEYRMPYMLKYSTKLASFLNQSCKTEEDFNNFPPLWDVRDLM